MEYDVSNKSRRVRDIPARLRPREAMDRFGVENVSEDVLLSIILRSGSAGRNVVELSQSLLQEFGSLTALAKSSVDELSSGVFKGLGRVKAQVLMAALELGKRMHDEIEPDGVMIKTPGDAARILRGKARTLDAECFWVLRLDSRNRMKGTPLDITRGILDASLVHPREVFREAVRSATAAVVLVHNHPSGDPSPSAEDIRITRQMIDAGKIVDIKVLDHVIIGGCGRPERIDFVSMREEGIVSF